MNRLYSKTACLLAVFAIFLCASKSADAQVWGKEGTQTSQPAGLGRVPLVNSGAGSATSNTNPGTVSTRTFPSKRNQLLMRSGSHRYLQVGVKRLDEVNYRKLLARQIETSYRVRIQWEDHSFRELSDFDYRISQEREIRRLGIDVDWKKHSSSNLRDQKKRIRIAKEIEKLGESVNWREHTEHELMKIQIRVLEESLF